MANSPILCLLVAFLTYFCLCVEEISPCKADLENAKCSIAKDGTATLTDDLPKNAILLEAKISPCEVTGSLWSCEEIGWKVKDCQILSQEPPFKAKCPIESGAWCVKFKILKPKGCQDPVDPSVRWDCEQYIRIYQNV